MTDSEKVERELAEKVSGREIASQIAHQIAITVNRHIANGEGGISKQLEDGFITDILVEMLTHYTALIDQGMEQRWIPVSERLPVTGEFVEVFTKRGNFHGPATLVTNADDETRWALKNGSWIKPEYVSHWRLPAPPSASKGRTVNMCRDCAGGAHLLCRSDVKRDCRCPICSGGLAPLVRSLEDEAREWLHENVRAYNDGSVAVVTKRDAIGPIYLRKCSYVEVLVAFARHAREKGLL